MVAPPFFPLKFLPKAFAINTFTNLKRNSHFLKVATDYRIRSPNSIFSPKDQPFSGSRVTELKQRHDKCIQEGKERQKLGAQRKIH